MTPALESASADEDLQLTKRKRRRRWYYWRLLLNDPPSLVSLIVVIVVVFCAIAAPLIAPHDPVAQDLSLRLAPPVWQEGSVAGYPLGADALGRDMLSRIIFGARASLVIGVGAVLLQGFLGVTIGLLAGFYGGWVDNVAMRATDIQQGIPFLILAIALAAVVQPSVVNIIIVLGVAGWVTYSRVVRGQVLSLREQEFIEAARVIGNRHSRILIRHVLPNTLPSVVVIGTLTLSTMILAEASLSFLGLGVPPPTPTWGGMVADGRDYLVTAWWVSTLPGLAIFSTVLAINLFGDWLREVLDPTL